MAPETMLFARTSCCRKNRATRARCGKKKKTLKIPEPRNDIIGVRYEFQVMYSKSATRDAIVAVSVKHVPE